MYTYYIYIHTIYMYTYHIYIHTYILYIYTYYIYIHTIYIYILYMYIYTYILYIYTYYIYIYYTHCLRIIHRSFWQDVEHVFLLALSVLEIRLELFRRRGGLDRADELRPARPAWALRRRGYLWFGKLQRIYR